MANVDAAFGFRPIGSDFGPYNGKTQRCFVPTSATTTDLFVGDLVSIGGSASTDGYPTVAMITSSTTVPFYGVVSGIEANKSDLSIQYGKKGTARYVQVVPLTGGYFEVQFDGLSELADVGLNTLVVLGAGSTVTGQSGYEISATDPTVTADNEVQIIAFKDSPDNDPTLTNAVAIIRFNDSQLKIGRTGI